MNIEHLEKLLGYKFDDEHRGKLEELLEEAGKLDRSTADDMLFNLWKSIDILASIAADAEAKGEEGNIEDKAFTVRELRSYLDLVRIVGNMDGRGSGTYERRR